jgi:hypothetical protein
VPYEHVQISQAELAGANHAIQKIFEDTLKSLAEHIPPSRELSIVTTKLEEACFFAKKGMAVVTDNQMEAE